MNRSDCSPVSIFASTATQEFHVGPATTATPGLFAGLAALVDRFGSMPLNELVAPAAGALDPEAGDGYLALWHGLSLALGLTVITIAAGIGLFLGRDRVQLWQSRLPQRQLSEEGYEGTLVLLNRIADRWMQHGFRRGR